MATMMMILTTRTKKRTFKLAMAMGTTTKMMTTMNDDYKTTMLTMTLSTMTTNMMTTTVTTMLMITKMTTVTMDNLALIFL
jgi:hypothetical protein